MSNTQQEAVLVGDQKGPLRGVNECLTRVGIEADLIDPSERSTLARTGRHYRNALVEVEYSLRVLQDSECLSSVAVRRDISITSSEQVRRLIGLLRELLPGNPFPTLLYQCASLNFLKALQEVSQTFIPASEPPEVIVARWLHKVSTGTSPAPTCLLRHAMAEAFGQIQYRLSNQPFCCACLACGCITKCGEFEIWAGAVPPEIRAQAQTFREAVCFANPVSFELPSPTQDERRTIALLPVESSTLILSKVDRPRQEMSDYGMDTHFLYQASLAVGEVLAGQADKTQTMGHAKRQVDETADAVLAAFEREQQAFGKMLPQLLRSCKGWFVAFHSGDKVDQDADEIALARRVERRFKHEFVLVTQVLEERETAVLDSPEG